jgi:hypothetical protein
MCPNTSSHPHLLHVSILLLLRLILPYLSSYYYICVLTLYYILVAQIDMGREEGQGRRGRRHGGRGVGRGECSAVEGSP